jgi:replicative DNA helicase
MINTHEFEKIFLIFALQNPTYLEPIERHFFSVPEIDLLATLSKRYYKKYKIPPSKENLWMLISTGELTEKCNKIFFDEVFKKNIKDYDIKWVEETAQSWIKWKHLDSSIVDTVEFINTAKVTPENVSEIVENVKNLINGRNNITFDDDLGSSFWNEKSHERLKENLISSNYHFFDDNSGGHSKGTVVIYVAPPNVGKSLFMGQDAAKYIKAGKNVLYISLEMGAQKIHKRIGSDLFNIIIEDYDKKSENPEYMKKKIKEFRDQSIIEPGDLTIKNYPTSSATVDDIDNFIGKVQDITNIKYDVVIVDYLNILRDKRNPNSESTYLKIKNISEDLRALSQRRNLVIISASQTTRSGANNLEIDLSHIAESAGLAATVDTIFAIIQTPEMNLENMYWLKVLKDRDGKCKHMRCKIDVDYRYMRLHETNTVMHASE